MATPMPISCLACEQAYEVFSNWNTRNLAGGPNDLTEQAAEALRHIEGCLSCMERWDKVCGKIREAYAPAPKPSLAAQGQKRPEEILTEDLARFLSPMAEVIGAKKLSMHTQLGPLALAHLAIFLNKRSRTHNYLGVSRRIRKLVPCDTTVGMLLAEWRQSILFGDEISEESRA